jgi:hypothetical protein
MSRAPAPEVLRQLMAAGLHPCCSDLTVHDQHLRFVLSEAGRAQVAADARFLSDPWNFLHLDVGPNLRGFRSINGSLGWGSLQIVVSEPTGAAYADVDRHNTQDLVNIVGHLFGSVIPGWFRKLAR